MAAHEEIEQRTEKDVIEILARNNIKPHTSNGYSLAKKLCFEGKFITPDIYDKQIRWVLNYLEY